MVAAGSPNSFRENLSPFLLSNHPMFAGRLNATSHGGITRRQQHPTLGHTQDTAIRGFNAVRRWPWAVGRGHHTVSLPCEWSDKR